jgi:UBX domain-containing protein 1
MVLQMIRQGRAPLHLMNVSYDQPVNVSVQQHEKEWRQLPKVYRPFGGSGRRLGSPVPGQPAVAPAPITTTTTSTTSAALPTSIDESQPVITIRIQMPDGTRLPARFNITQTIGDVYHFIQQASTDTRTRSWVLATTFPNKEHQDRGLVLGEMAEFKKGGTAVVKWV